MRSQLDAEMDDPGRRDGRLRRFGIPVAAAAAVMVAAIGGYALLGGNNRDGFSPAGGPDTKSPKPTATVTSPPTSTTPPKPKPVPTQSTPPAKPELKPGQAYRKCIQLMRDHGEPVKGLSGKVTVSNDKGTTVVVANRTDAYTCNVRPDDAVSNPRPFDSAVSEETFAVANNATRNVIPDDPGDYAWGGGALPDGVTSITYAFPDGHKERATVRDGFWVMQYFSVDPLEGATSDPIKVTVDGPGGQRELTLEWGTHTCNQVSHGC